MIKQMIALLSGFSLIVAAHATTTTTIRTDVLKGKPTLSIVNSGATLTLPTSGDTLIGANTANELKNKTISSANNTLSIDFPSITGTASTGQIPNLAASKITSGQLAVAQGGTGQDFSGSTGLVKLSAGTASAATLVNADVSASAAIALSKLAAGSSWRLFAADASGVMTQVAAAPTATSHVLTSAGPTALPTWAPVAAAAGSGTTEYFVTFAGNAGATSGCGASPCTVVAQRGSGANWVTSVTRVSAGLYDVNTSITFGATPLCNCAMDTINAGASAGMCAIDYANSTTTLVRVRLWTTAAGGNDSGATVSCRDPSV